MTLQQFYFDRERSSVSVKCSKHELGWLNLFFPQLTTNFKAFGLLNSFQIKMERIMVRRSGSSLTPDYVLLLLAVHFIFIL